jgi:hypothetical protein
MCFGRTKTHLRAYVTFKNFPGVIPRTLIKREGRDGEGRVQWRRSGLKSGEDESMASA